MQRTWETDAVVRHLSAEADKDEMREVIEQTDDDPGEALREWARTGNAPKSLYDDVQRFSSDPDHAFNLVDWDTVIEEVFPTGKV